jgi:hypothetical protein
MKSAFSATTARATLPLPEKLNGADGLAKTNKDGITES